MEQKDTRWYKPRFLDDGSTLLQAKSRYGHDGSYRHNPEPLNETLDEVDNIAAPPLNIAANSLEDKLAIIQNSPLGLPHVRDADYRNIFGGPAGEVSLRNIARQKQFEESPKARLAELVSGATGYTFEQMFEPSPVKGIPSGYEFPRNDLIPGTNQPIHHFSNTSESGYRNVDLAGRYAALSNLKAPEFWTDEEKRFSPMLKMALAKAVVEIKQGRKSLRRVPAVENFYVGVPEDFLTLLADYIANIIGENDRIHPKRATFNDDIDRIPAKRRGKTKVEDIEYQPIKKMEDYKWDEVEEKIVYRGR